MESCAWSAFLVLLISLLNSFLVQAQILYHPSQAPVANYNPGNNYGYCRTGNPIDNCWRCDPNWASNRHKLADCAMGFGRGAIGGRNGREYIVTDPSDDPVNPRPGTLRYGVIQWEPLWITFAHDMTIVLQQELIVNSHKTIDGRGQSVEIAYGACITIQYVSNIIIHGVHVHDCKRTGNTMVRSTPNHVGWRTMADGDGISLFGANQVWVDHVTVSRCSDGLIDAIMGSTAITISNSLFSDHDKVMLLGHNDNYTADKRMQVSLVYNHFAQNLIQRMPRCRQGFFEVVNNDYSQWEMYALGGSASPTIFSRGNLFMAPNNPHAKNVTMRMNTPQSVWEGWNWHSQGDMLLNGAMFVASGASSSNQGVYNNAQSNITPFPASQVPTLTANAGVLTCQKGSPC